MTDQAEQVSTTGLVDTKQRPGATKRRQYSEALKRQIVAETQEPGSSVSIVARRDDVNSNQLFKMAAGGVSRGDGRERPHAGGRDPAAGQSGGSERVRRARA